MNLLALALSLTLSQTMYEWTDAKGETHFTDDKGSIPRGAKVKTTEGGDVTTMEEVKTPSPSRPDKRNKGGEVDTCARAKKKVDALELKLAKSKQEYELAQLRYDGKCAEIASRFGAAEEARCLRRGRKSVTPPTPNDAALRAEYAGANDELRKAQVSGCR